MLDSIVEDDAMLLLEEDIAILELEGAVELPGMLLELVVVPGLVPDVTKIPTTRVLPWPLDTGLFGRLLR